MRLRKYYITATAVAFLGVMLYGQHDQSFFQIKEYLNSSENYNYYTAHKHDGIDGSPYLNDSLIKGLVHFNGSWYLDVPLRYDSYSEQMQANISNQGLVVLDPSALPVDSIIVYDELFIPRNVPGKSQTIFLVPLQQ